MLPYAQLFHLAQNLTSSHKNIIVADCCFENYMKTEKKQKFILFPPKDYNCRFGLLWQTPNIFVFGLPSLSWDS